jgi:hypothetical protein
VAQQLHQIVRYLAANLNLPALKMFDLSFLTIFACWVRRKLFQPHHVIHPQNEENKFYAFVQEEDIEV